MKMEITMVGNVLIRRELRMNFSTEAVRQDSPVCHLKAGPISSQDYHSSPYIREGSGYCVKKRKVTMQSQSDDLKGTLDSDTEATDAHKNAKKAFRNQNSRSKSINESLRMTKQTRMTLQSSSENIF